VFFDISAYNFWDSEPPEDGESSDYGLITSPRYGF
jgi:hypothetical protein